MQLFSYNTTICFMNKITIILILLLSVIIPYRGVSQEVGIGQWRDHLPYDYATQVEEFKTAIYCATPYSMFYYDREYNSVHRLSKVNGLSDLGISDISLNQELSILVISYSNTNVDLILPNDNIINIPDIKRKEILGNKTINSIMNYGKFAYLSCGFAIVVLNLEKMEVRDTYYIGPEGSSINVLSMTYNDTAFFAATEKGIYYADKSDPNLAYFANWKKMTDIPYPEGFYSLIHNYRGKLFINYSPSATNTDELYVLENGAWTLFESESNTRINSMRTSGDKMVVSFSYYVRIYNPDLSEYIKIYSYGESSPIPSDAFIGTDGNFWIADQSKGLVKSWAGGFERQFIKPSGAPTADIFDMTVQEGKLYLVPGGLTGTWGNTWRGARMFSFIDETWKAYDAFNSPGLDTLRDFVSVFADPLNSDHVYAGSWNRGMAEFKDEAIMQIYNADNSSLMPNVIEGYPSVKVGGGAFDSQNNLWVTNSGAEKILSVKRRDGSWEAFGLGSATIGIDIRKIIVDSYDQKWILTRTTQSSPNYILVFNEKNPAGNQVRGLRSAAGMGNLPGSNVYSIAEDQDGYIWVGTDQGVAVFYSPQNMFTGENYDAQRILVNIDGYVQYLLETEAVRAIAIDGANRKWIGTERAGVFLLSKDGTQQIQHFTEENSPLFSNNITSMAISGKTGEVFIGTAKGLISYKGTATEGGETNTDVYAYPNPVRPGYTGTIAINGLVQNAIVKITDINGRLVYEPRVDGGQATWNGADLDGRRVNSGVYLVFITNRDGSEKIVTKILFLN